MNRRVFVGTKCRQLILHATCLSPDIQWEFQDPKMDVLYHIFGQIFEVPEMAIDPRYGLKIW